MRTGSHPLLTFRNAVAVIAMLAVVWGAWLAPLDAPATEQVEAGLKRALISFAAARALNGVISVAQGTEVSVQPLGVGVTLAPGQLLDPINDLIEQFSNLMLLSVFFLYKKMSSSPYPVCARRYFFDSVKLALLRTVA